VEERRRELEELRMGALEAVAASGIGLGGARLAGAERAARELVSAAPLREAAHRLLMEALAARGERAQALAAYEQLRLLLRDELGTAPGAPIRALHERLLSDEEVVSRADAARAAPLPEALGRRSTDGAYKADPRAAALLEREAELSVLGATLADARAGDGRLVVIEGPAGIGKTRLMEETRAAAAELGLGVLHARGGEFERDFGFGVVRQLLEPRLVGVEHDERTELFAGAAGLAEPVIAPQSGGPAPPGDLSHAALHGLYWLVVNLTERAPLLIAVDDLQWVDGPSLRFLHYVVTRLEGVPVAIVATLRTGEASPESELLDGLMLAADVVRPPALSGAAITSIVRARLGEDTPPELCDACYESSRGNPYLIGELLLEIAGAGPAATGTDPAAGIDPGAVRRLGPRRIAKSVLLRVGRLGAEARALARALAVLGEVDELSRAAALARLEAAEAGELVDALSELAVLSAGRPVRFAHPVVRTAIYQEIPASERSSLQRRAAELFSDDPEQAAVHLLATEPESDPRTVVTLRAAARAAQARGAPESAVRYLGRALAEPPEPTVRPELLGELGTAEALIGNADATEHLTEAFELGRTQPARAMAGAVLGHQLIDAQGGRPERAVTVLERALEGLEDPLFRQVLEAHILMAGVTALAARPVVARRLQMARAHVEQLPDEQARLLLVPVALDVSLTDTAAAAIRLAERSLGDGELIEFCVSTGQPFAHQLGAALTHVGEWEAAERTLTDAMTRYGERGGAMPVAAGAAVRAHARYLAGRLAAAEADARLSLEEPALAGWPIPLSIGAAALVFVLVERGRLREARATLEAFQPLVSDPEAPPCQPLRAGRAYLLAAEGDPQAALDALRECERFERDWQADSGVCPVAWRSQAALCHHDLGDTGRARALAEEELALARRRMMVTTSSTMPAPVSSPPIANAPRIDRRSAPAMLRPNATWAADVPAAPAVRTAYVLARGGVTCAEPASSKL
jgi:tetratricopeptide (TPR) repeat protein